MPGGRSGLYPGIKRKHQIEEYKPILFNTDMVRAILEGRKTVTRRVVKPRPDIVPIPTFGGNYRVSMKSNLFAKPPYRPGNILYVRETWRIWRAHRYDADAYIEFRAGGEGTVIRFPYGYTDSVNRDGYDRFIHKWGVRENKWRPSIHMPREAARIFLRVTGVRVERLQDISMKDVRNEGIEYDIERPVASYGKFVELWDSTIRPGIRALYGWGGNPWVWVIEFERYEKSEAAP